jgi:predicted nucleic acid-binding protein
MQYLVDTGVLLRLFDGADPDHAGIRQALRLLRSRGDVICVCPQNIAEFWNVSTRPAIARGGYGKDAAATELRVRFIERNAVVLDESPAAYRQWRSVIVQHQIKGVAVHDARLVSMMHVAAISHILTLNVSDFARYQSVTAIRPQDI